MAQIVGKQISDVEPNYPYKILYVSVSGDDSNPGTKDLPVATMAQAWTLRVADNGFRYTIKVDAGVWVTTLTLTDIGVDEQTNETYIEGMQDGVSARWASGAEHIILNDAGWVYFIGYGYYGSLEVNQTGTRKSFAVINNIWCYGALKSTGIADTTRAGVEVWGTNGWIDINAGSDATLVMPIKVRGALLATTVDVTINELSLFGGTLMALSDIDVVTFTGLTNPHISLRNNKSVDVTGTYEGYGLSVSREGTGDFVISGSITVLAKVMSSLVEYDNSVSGLAATNVQDVITEVHGLIALSLDDKDAAASVTTADFQTSGISITNTPSGFIQVLVNGNMVRSGDGIKTKECYFSGDAGTTARAWTAIVATDTLYWVGSVAGFELATTDKIDLIYIEA